jgi:SAM-dependent methyltransferase
MYGGRPAAVKTCRYLEVGCNEAAHLIACALALPDARFVGIDLSPAAIDRGRRLIDALGLTNVSLAAADLTTWEPPEGGFDYVAAHGVYSWVPPPVRDGLLELLARALRPHGIGFVSYNTYPGCFVRRMVWEMMNYHIAGEQNPDERMDRAVGMARLLQGARPAGQAPDAVALPLLQPELTEITQHRDRRAIYYDDIAPVNDPVYFHEFATHAGRFGLRFVAEADQFQMATHDFPPDVAEFLNGLTARDVLRKEQYVDFLRLRRFRQTLLSCDGAAPRQGPDPVMIGGLAVSSDLRPEGVAVDLADGVPGVFRTERGAIARTPHAILKAALVELGEAWPARLPFGELQWAAARRLGRNPVPDDTDLLSRFLTLVWQGGLVALHGDSPRYARAAPERPVASPLARWQLRSGTEATTLLHSTIQFQDPVGRNLVLLLDGTRDLDRLTADLLGAFPPDQRPAPDGFRVTVERNVARLARFGLFIA